MKTNLTSLFLILSVSAFAQMQFVAPMPGSTMQNPNRNIVIRPGNLLDASSLSSSSFIITGSLSGTHDFNMVLANDGKSINLNPVTPFAYGEKVDVTIKQGIQQISGDKYNGYSFSFSIRQQYSTDEEQQIKMALEKMRTSEMPAALQNANQSEAPAAKPYQILVNTNPTPGQVFFCNGGFTDQTLWIVQNNGDSVYQKKSPNDGFDWKLNHNGLMTAYNSSPSFSIFDSNYVKVRSVTAVNGYSTDVHELQMFPDGHYFLIADDPEIVDMSKYVQNGQTHATVTGNVVQEFDANNNLLFEWRTFDHIIITEAPHENLTNGFIDATHMNALEQDNDGNLLVSCRHLDQVFKLDLSNGNFIWRLGGDSNQYVFTNDPAKFDYQHDIRRLANGDITIFDNNNWGSPNTSYAKEYQLDEVNKKATLVWSYAHPLVNNKTLASSAMGNIQRFDNGNTLIDWGIVPFNGNFANMTEIDPSFNIVWELRYQNSEYVYRAHRYSWSPCARPTDSKITVTGITSTSATINWNPSTGAVKYNVQYRKKGTTNWKNVKVSSPAVSVTLTGLLTKKTYEYEIQTWCTSNGSTASNFTAIKTFKTLAAREENLSVNNVQSFNLYPNPGSDAVTIQWTQNDHSIQNADVQVFNLIGQEVMEKKLSSNEGNNESTLDMSSLNNGFYLIRINVGAQQFQTKWNKQ